MILSGGTSISPGNKKAPEGQGALEEGIGERYQGKDQAAAFFLR